MKPENQSVGQRLASPEETAFLDLFRTCDLLSRGPAEVLKTEDLSSTQYNVLRILRGAPKGLPCGEIAGRMITRDPDITRLLDRLAKRGLIARRRETRDRRVVLTKIAPEGLENALAAKGWSPTRVDAYRTRMPRSLPLETRVALREGCVDAVTFTSASTVRGFVRALRATRGNPKVVCIGPVTAREAREHGFTVAAVARPHTIEGLVAALERGLS